MEKAYTDKGTDRGTDKGDSHKVRVELLPRPELFLLPRETIFAMADNEVSATYGDMLKLDIHHMPYEHCIIGVPGDIVVRCNLSVDEDTQEIGIAYPTEDGDISKYHHPSFSVTVPKGTPIDEANAMFERAAANYAMNGWDGDMSQYREWEFRFYYFNGEMYMPTARSNRLGSNFKNLFEFQLEGPSGMPKSERVKADSSLKIRWKALGETLRMRLVVLLATRNAVKTRTKDKLLGLGIGKRKVRNNHKPLYTTTITVPKISNGPQGQPTGRTVSPHLRRGHVRQQAWGPRYQFKREVWIEPVFVNADENYVSTRVAYNTSKEYRPHDQPNQPN